MVGIDDHKPMLWRNLLKTDSTGLVYETPATIDDVLEFSGLFDKNLLPVNTAVEATSANTSMMGTVAKPLDISIGYLNSKTLAKISQTPRCAKI